MKIYIKIYSVIIYILQYIIFIYKKLLKFVQFLNVSEVANLLKYEKKLVTLYFYNFTTLQSYIHKFQRLQQQESINTILYKILIFMDYKYANSQKNSNLLIHNISTIISINSDTWQ